MEAEERPKAFEELGRQIQLYMKIIEAYKTKVNWHREPCSVRLRAAAIIAFINCISGGWEVSCGSSVKYCKYRDIKIT